MPDGATCNEILRFNEKTISTWRLDGRPELVERSRRFMLDDAGTRHALEFQVSQGALAIDLQCQCRSCTTMVLCQAEFWRINRAASQSSGTPSNLTGRHGRTTLRSTSLREGGNVSESVRAPMRPESRPTQNRIILQRPDGNLGALRPRTSASRTLCVSSLSPTSVVNSSMRMEVAEQGGLADQFCIRFPQRASERGARFRDAPSFLPQRVPVRASAARSGCRGAGRCTGQSWRH